MGTPRIFVSHSHEDDELGHRLVTDLQARLGQDAVWYDSKGGLQPGDEWWSRIVAEITARDTFIVIFSPSAVASGWVMDEVSIAWALRHRIGTRIIPILYQPCDIRADLLLLQFVSFVAPIPYGEAFAKLMQVLNISTTQVAAPQPTITEPVGPQARLIESLTQDVNAAFGKEDWNTTIAKSSLMLEEAPQGMSAALWRERGLAYLELGNGAAALEALDEALRADQFDVPSLRGKGIALRLVNRGQESAQVLERAYALAPFTDISLRLSLLGDLTETLRQIDEWTAAVQRIDEALRLSPDDPYWIELRLDTLTRAGREDEALSMVRGLADAQRDLGARWLNQLYNMHEHAAAWTQAHAVIDVALAAVPGDPVWLRRKLDVLTRLGRENEALTLAGDSISQQPSVVSSWLQAQYQEHLRSQEWTRALAVVDVGIKVPTEEPAWLRRKAEVLKRAGWTEEAKKTTDEVSREIAKRGVVDGGMWAAVVALAVIAGQANTAREALERASSLAGENSQAVVDVRKEYWAPFEQKRRALQRKRTLWIAFATGVALLGLVLIALSIASRLASNSARASALLTLVFGLVLWVPCLAVGTALTCTAIIQAIRAKRWGLALGLGLSGLSVAWILPFFGPYMYLVRGQQQKRRREKRWRSRSYKPVRQPKKEQSRVVVRSDSATKRESYNSEYTPSPVRPSPPVIRPAPRSPLPAPRQPAPAVPPAESKPKAPRKRPTLADYNDDYS